MFRKVLVANRGEIACRVIRTCRALGVPTVAVYSDPDRDEPHVRAAGEAMRLGPAAAAESYLAIERIIDAALRTDAEAIHPGYGFLAENPDFAEAVVEAGLTFIGPRPETMRLMSDKAAAKSHLEEAGVPTIPGVYDPDLGNDELADAAAELGFPVLLKPVAGGGGKGMRRVDGRESFGEEADAARREAEASFGDDRLLIEKLVERPRHIEFQVFGDTHGNVMHLFERECSIQRRHQKIVEETPSPALDEELRARMAEAAVDTARSVDYLGAGTVEMLLSDATQDFYFLEMNTRLQVEHPVTEMITGLDLVEWQLRVAAGEPLPRKVDEVPREGHSIEVRVYAEDPAHDYLPQAGRVLVFEAPTGPGLRVDVGVASGSAVGVNYDPMIAKLVVHGDDRRHAISRLTWALRRLVALGVTTNVAFLHDVVTSEPFVEGALTTHFLQEHFPEWSPPEPGPRVLAAAAAALVPTDAANGQARDPWGRLGPWRLARMGGWPVRLRDSHDTEHDLVVVGRGADLIVEAVADGQEASARRDASAGLQVSVRQARPVRQNARGALPGDGQGVSMPQAVPVESDVAGGRVLQLALDGHETAAHVVVSGHDVWVHVDGETARLRLLPATRHLDPGAAVAGRALEAPMPGEVAAVNVSVGDEVEAGDVLVVVEAMKMEHQVRAPVAGTVAEVHVAAGDSVDSGTPLVGLEPDESDGGEEEA